CCTKSHHMDHRLNYILWIQDIVHAHDYVLWNPRRRIRGIDIGTGSTAIYSFLGCTLEPEWEFVATELDDLSYNCASGNVNTNNMQSRIRLEKATREGSICFTLERNPKSNFKFTMCNPPFYTSSEEVAQSASEKDLVPNVVCMGADIEMIFANGGEEGFVGQMVEESEWKMSSVTTIVENLCKCSIVNYAITEFVEGQTCRWAVGFYSAYPFNCSRSSASFPNCSVPVLAVILDRNLHLLEDPGSVSNAVSSSSASRTLFMEAEGNTWSRSVRRRHRLN
ncbi:hypothetical protein BYT27DRAFT_7202316, partial [Phlegmacium glaucopus]